MDLLIDILLDAGKDTLSPHILSGPNFYCIYIIWRYNIDFLHFID